MNTNRHGFKKVAFGVQFAALSLVLASCNLPQPQADMVRHFTLTGPVVTAATAEGTTVRLVDVAGHLRTREMAVRVGENEIIYNEDVRWAESLDVAITQLLRSRLNFIPGGVVAVQVQRCELVRYTNNSVELAATYTITPRSAAEGEVRRGIFKASPRTWDGKDTGALVGLIRDAINELGDTLAKAVVEK